MMVRGLFLYVLDDVLFMVLKDGFVVICCVSNCCIYL